MKHPAYMLIGCILPALLLSACGPVTAAPSLTAASSRPTQTTIVSLTFDDGDADNFPVAAVLAQYGLHGTFYIPSGLVGKPAYMTWEQLQTLSEQGHEIGGHTVDHINIGEVSGAELRHQVCDDRQRLMDHGFKPVSFAYPFGGYNDAAKLMVRECGYTDARTIGAGPDQMPPVDAYALRAFPYVVVNTEFGKLQRYVTGTRKEGGGWVILIFHHVCDACDYFAVRPDVLNRFITWLAGQQSSGNIKVRTVGEVVLGGIH